MVQKLKTYLSAVHFRGGLSVDDIYAKLIEKKNKGEDNFLSLGKLFGIGVTSEVMVQKDPKYADKDASINIIGEFKFFSHVTGEITEGLGVIPPRYFAKMIQKQVSQSEDGASFAVEIGAELTGRTIPWAWTVINLLPREADSRFGRLEATLRASNLLDEPEQRKAIKSSSKAA